MSISNKKADTEKKKIVLKINTKNLSEKLSQLNFHLTEAKRIAGSINHMKAKDLIDR